MEKKSFKKIVIIGILLVATLVISLVQIINKNQQEKKEREKIVNAKVEIVLSDDLTIGLLEEKRVSDYIVSINGEIIDDYIINSREIGNTTVEFQFINDEGIIVNYSYEIEVKDLTAPFAVVKDTYYIKKGGSKNFHKNIFCGDNYDDTPECYIEGEYDVNKEGTYPVVFKAVDDSGNTYSKNINVIVYEKSNSSSGSNTSSSTAKKTYFEDVVAKYKTEKTKIGIDVSKWQGKIDFDQLKEAGVEFIFIRVGWGYQGEYKLDEYFVRNITEANRVGIPVGVYFYSYARMPIESINDALWVVEQIKDYDVELPIAFDWEEWGDFNDYDVSFYGLTKTAKAFLSVMNLAGYDGLLYSSKFYLENVWFDTGYEVWLAHYTDKTDYDGEYRFWQLCNNGRVSGIKGDIDINIWYLD